MDTAPDSETALRAAGHRVAATPSRGLSLVETLIAVVVLGIALLGLGASLAAALAGDRQSVHRAVAVIRAHTIIDRIRANPAGFAAGQYQLERAYADIDPGTGVSGCDTSASPCSPAALAAVDIARWNAANSRLLPGGRGALAGDFLRGHTASIMWRDHSLGEAGGVDPACAHKTPPESIVGLRCINVSFEP